MSSFKIVNVMEGEVWFGWPEAGYGPQCIRNEDLDKMEEAIRKAKESKIQKPKGSDGTANPTTALRVTEPEGRVKASPMPLPRLVFWKKDLCLMLGVLIRSLDRMISAGEIPPPDRRLRGRPAWLARTINEWVESGCPPHRTTEGRIS